VLRKRSGKFTLNIAENGQMRLSQQNQSLLVGSELEVRAAEIVQMLPDSTLWPFFILLRLRRQNKKTVSVPFFLGSLPPALFRRLSVACRWIAAQNEPKQSYL
jgi:toxin CptA